VQSIRGIVMRKTALAQSRTSGTACTVYWIAHV
jgi:hypothetical protein